ncbi:phosphoribosylaminoimidazole-succinocarboxamide synthase [Colletotrichum karsti]|uniref:Phosphoribosylaminoimidazole-succinocarboxamide synthase n=1 Tax=Colletotrichum karsti TaxID=1095194 RepID=A0A9P6IBU8_9PEZI|nr:phosphoribosylaminoimidazole-succinocarboxamide synthase [Colletotrichum karsti]KAF9879624.1 phosphoribosylaminoimidazole-succinocarboxamide synthase [Colletotrichum karsti]
MINRVRSSSLPSDFGAEVGEMRPGSLLLPLAAAASAVAASAGDVSEYVMVREEEAPPVSWTSVPARDKGLSSVDGVVESIGGALLRAAGAVTRTARSFTWSADDTSSRQRRSFATERDVSGTVYQVIRENDRGRLFSELLDGHESLRQMLDDPGREVTVFLPADDAMRRLEGPGAVDEASVREILEYHVLSGVYPLDALREARAAHTVLEEGGMGRRQRVRVEEGVEGVDVNFYARVSGGDSIQTANGIVHFVDDVLVPPPRHDKLIEALPERLSVFAEALRRTGMRPRGGVTVFAPSDDAWEALGAEAEGFLFSDEGEEYLRALVGYHVVEDAVVYSDTETLGEFESGHYPPQLWSARTPSQQSSTPNTLRPHHATRRNYENGIDEEDSSPQETISPPPPFVPHAPTPPTQQPHTQNFSRPDQSFPAPVLIGGGMFNNQDPYVSQPAARFNDAQLAVDEVANRARARGFRDELTLAAGRSITPGVDDTPYIHHALEAITRDHGNNFSPPSSMGSQGYNNEGYYRAAGYLPDDLQNHSPQISGDPETGFQPMMPAPPSAHARDSLLRPQSQQERQSMSLGTRLMSPPQSADSRYRPSQDRKGLTPEPTSKWLPISERETVFPGMTKLDTVDESRETYPRLTYVPAILRLPSMIALTTLCVLMIVALMLSAIYSPIQPGLLTYGETIYSAKYFLFRILPQTCAAAIFVYAQCVTTATLRILPFVAMTEDEPMKRRNALFMNLYPKSFLLPQLAGPVHVKVALAILWLSAFTIPLASASFTVIHKEVWYWTAVQGTVWALVALYFLLVAALVILALYWRNRVTGLMWDPRSIADFSFMISKSNTRESYRGSEVAENRLQLRHILRNRIVDRLGYWMTDDDTEAPWYGIGTEHSQGQIPSDIHYDAKGDSDRRSITSNLIVAGHDDYIRNLYLPWCLRTSPLLFFVVAATVLLAALFVVSFLNRTSLVNGFDPRITAAPGHGAFSPANFLYSFVPSLVGLLLYLAFQSLDHHLRVLQPWADLGHKDGSPASRSVLADYAACLPLQSTLHALRNRHYRVAALSLLSLLLAFLPALAGALFMALTAVPSGGVRMFPLVPVFAVLLALLTLYLAALVSLLFRRNHLRLPHAVSCPAEIFSFLANEDNAQDPVFRSPGPPRARAELAHRLGAGPASAQSTWMFGYWPGRDERRLGVRRQRRYTERKSFHVHERTPSRRSMI